MLTPQESETKLKRFFGKYRVGQLEDLFQLLQTRSRMSVFRRLKTLGYLSSFTHAGRYYTLANLPEFDRWGLWFHRQVGFSKVGTLKATIVELVQSASDGMTPKEMRGLLRLPVSNTLYNTLHELVHSAQLQSQGCRDFPSTSVPIQNVRQSKLPREKRFVPRWPRCCVWPATRRS